jgi:hypothetical protein
MSLRRPGGGKKLRKKLSRKWLQETVKQQQLVINALCAKLDEARIIVNEVIKAYPKPESKVETLPFIIPAR